jgi:hypothetical protein
VGEAYADADILVVAESSKSSSCGGFDRRRRRRRRRRRMRGGVLALDRRQLALLDDSLTFPFL